MTQLRRCIPFTLAAVLLVAAAGPAAQSNAPPEEFSAFAINMGAYTIGTTANLIITVNRWSTVEERDRFLEILRAKGPDGLIDALRGAPRLGSIRTAESIGYELRFAMQEPGADGGRRIIIATDRPLGFGEAANRSRTVEYPFTVVDMQMPAKGFGGGSLSLAARIIPTGKNIVVENYDTQPIRLNRIESRKLKK